MALRRSLTDQSNETTLESTKSVTMSSSSCPLSAERNGLEFLREHLFPVESIAESDRDVILIALDFENPATILKSRSDVGCQLGVAILDTRNLAYDGEKPWTIIKTHNFAVGSPSYQQTARDRFLFGRSLPVTSHQDLASNLESLISPLKRDIIFIGHNIQVELKPLHYLGFDLRTCVIGALDTGWVASEGLPPDSPTPALQDLLSTLKCPFNKLHSAGNDAHFTLRALLLLAVKSYEADGAATLRPEDQKKLQFLKTLANIPLPPARLTASEKNRKRNIKRARYIQEKKKRERDPENMLRVRAERAAKRQATMESMRNELIMKSTTDEPPTENTTAEPPVQNTTDDLAMESATGELPLESPIDEPDMEHTTDKPPLESTTDQLPMENTMDEVAMENRTARTRLERLRHFFYSTLGNKLRLA